MADLKDTSVRGDLYVEGIITPWGGSYEGFAYIGYIKNSYSLGTIADGSSSGRKTYDVQVVDGTDAWVPAFIGAPFVIPYSIVTDIPNKKLTFNALNISGASHTCNIEWAISCFKKL